MSTDIKVPTLGESVSEATVAKWFKQVGDSVAADESLVELETDKVTIEVPAPAAGVLSAISAKVGDTVNVGAVLGEIGEGSGAPAKKPEAKAEAAAPAPTVAPKPEAGPAPIQPAAKGDIASPAASKLIAENNLSNVPGTGKDGRVTKGDVLQTLAAPPPAAAPAPRAPRAEDPREERVRMTRLRKRIAERLKEAQNTAAMLTTFNEVDMSAAMALRSEYKDAFEKRHGGVRLGFMSFFVKACIQALGEFPAVNAEVDGDEIVYKNFVHMGIAVGGPSGLVVPVIRDAHRLSFAEIERAIGDFGKRARDGQLKLDELAGGSFSITNGGVYGSLMSTPILNPPQSAILGMHKIQERPIAVGGKVEIRPMMYLALSYDHRIVDGKEAVSFLVRVKEGVEDPRRLLLGL
jgi:2-oxoglutarate dehydrogenase E2 component (dihydrolipoamide succinyltransferase)